MKFSCQHQREYERRTPVSINDVHMSITSGLMNINGVIVDDIGASDYNWPFQLDDLRDSYFNWAIDIILLHERRSLLNTHGLIAASLPYFSR